MKETAFSQEQVNDLAAQTFTYLLVEVKDHVLTMTLNRPQKKNAMNPVFMNEIVFALNHAKYNKDIWAVVLQANGDIFCAGADLKAFAGHAQEETDSTIPTPEKAVVLGDAFNSLHKPCIAKVHGNAYAGAFLLICGCTHVVAAEHVTFSLPEVKRGIWPMQVMASLKPIVPARQLLDLCMRARTIYADEALKLGIVTDITHGAMLNQRVHELVEEIKTLSPAAIRLGLKAWHEMDDVADSEQHPFLLKRLSEILKTKDAAEGLQAFIEKRAPQWSGE